MAFPSLEVADAEAVGVELNRLQNVVVTLDKVGATTNRMNCLKGTKSAPPLLCFPD
jgi:hypothetical protein